MPFDSSAPYATYADNVGNILLYQGSVAYRQTSPGTYTTVTTQHANPAAVAQPIPNFPSGAQTFSTSDTAYLPAPSIIYVGGAGNVKVTTAQGDDVTFNGLLAGQVIPVQVIRVWTTSLTATNLLRVS
jgi:hypothetical protein